MNHLFEGRKLNQQNQYAEAVEVFTQGLKENPNNYHIYSKFSFFFLILKLQDLLVIII